MSTDHHGAGPRMGPNAITRLAEAVRNLKGEASVQTLFDAADLSHYLATPPLAMVDEADVMALHRALYRIWPRDEAERVLRVAGVLTARYLIANRIPPLARTLIGTMPKPLGGRLLLGAIQKNAWTFAGSAEVSADKGRDTALLMRKCQLCRGLDACARPCRYHEATIETLYRALVSPRAEARMEAFSSRRGGACAVEIAW